MDLWTNRTAGASVLDDADALDRVSLSYEIGDLSVPHDFAEDRVPAVQVGLFGVGEEELAATGVLPGESHSHSAAFVAMTVHFAADLVGRASPTVASWASVLEDEVGDDTVPRAVVVEAVVRELGEVPTGEGSVAREEARLERTGGGLEDHAVIVLRPLQNLGELREVEAGLYRASFARAVFPAASSAATASRLTR